MAELCIALDTDKERAKEIIEELKGLNLVFKVGPYLYFSSRGEIVDRIKDCGFKLFIDFKFHDIPNTVRLAIRSVEEIGADITTVHILGGKHMIEEALKERKKTKIIGVTLLTSQDEDFLKSMGINSSVRDYVLKLANTGISLGLDGVVCSGREIGYLKENIKKPFITVVPGISYGEVAGGDQRRTVSVEEAKEKGADIIVMGRSLINRRNLRKEVMRILGILEP